MSKNQTEGTESSAAPFTEVLKVLQNIDDWSFDVFKLSDATKRKTLKCLSSHLFNHYGVLQKFQIAPVTLERFTDRIEAGYSRFNNPYHNNLHAADVTQTVHFMLCRTGLKNWMTDLEIFAILLAAMIHDYEHTGTTNNFHVMTRSDRALIYNDRSVQENHHISASFFVLKQDDCNILSNLSHDEYRQLRSLVIDMVLSTDMAYHFQIMKDMKNRIISPDLTMEKSKVLALVLHTCDISNVGKKWSLHHRWTMLLLEEFFTQGDRERELGLPVSPLCNRHDTLVPEAQIHFIDFIVEPALTVCSDMLEWVLEPIADLCKDANANLDGENVSEETPGIDAVEKKFHIRKPWIACLEENKRNWKERAVKARVPTIDKPRASN